ncbi:MAG: SET domain-containing protein [Bacteroidota bacterium]
MAFHQVHPSLFVADTEHKGRGVFTTKKIPADTIIETAPVIVFDAAQRKLLEQTALYNYIFEWGDDYTGCCVALGLVSIYNHASPSNCEYLMVFETETIIIRTVRDIAAGEELSINYSADWDEEKPVWFEMKKDDQTGT